MKSLPIDKKAKSQWERAQHAYDHYRLYVTNKNGNAPFALSFIDFIYVKNFKGGSATIAEPRESFDKKKIVYEKKLEAFASFTKKKWAAMNDSEHKSLSEQIVSFAAIPSHDESHISGFGESFSSALLHFHFPNHAPILDKRALNGARIDGMIVDAYKNVKNMLSLYPRLLDFFYERLKENKESTVRVIDQELFIQPLRAPLK